MTYKVGDTFQMNGEKCRIMAIAEGWAFVRFPRAVPFAIRLDAIPATDMVSKAAPLVLAAIREKQKAEQPPEV
jgi:hypothetical protein